MIRLFCVPYAGGSALVYKPWIADFQRQGIELIPLEMKGRGSRITESFYADFEEAKEDLLQMIYQYLEESDHPFAFLGHSMGSLLAYELALSVSEKGFIPSHLFLSGGQPPHSGWNHNSYYHSSDQLLKEHLLHLGGMPDIIMNNESLYHYFVHIIKEDYRIMDTYIVRKSYNK